MLLTAEPGSRRLRNHIRRCASDNGTRSGRTCGTSGGRWESPAAIAASTSVASCAAVGASKNSRTSMRTLWSALIRATTRVALSELPPRAKKSSSTPSRSTPSTLSNAATTVSSVGVLGARYSVARTLKSGSGSAPRSSLPDALRGNSVSSTNSDGTM